MDAGARVPSDVGPPRSTWSTTAVVGLVWVVVAASAVGRLVLFGPVGRSVEMSGPVLPTDIVGPLVAAALASLGGLVVLRGDARRYGWLMLALAASVGVVGFAGHYSLSALAATPEATWPFTATAGWIQDLWMVSWLLGLLLLPALFPDGTTASSRWRRPVRLAAAGWVALIVMFMLTERTLTNVFLEMDDPPANPTGVLPVPEMAINLAWVALTLASIVIGIGSLVTRWRRAEPQLRQQFKWVLYAFAMLLAVAAVDLGNQVTESALGLDLGLSWPINVLSAMTVVGLVVALGLAVLKLRLYDVDLVINRTIVYGALTVAIVAVYIGMVAGVGALLPLDETLLSLVATGVVAVAFAPLRARVQRRVNRLMFGQRDDPYALLSGLGRLLARSGTPEATLQNLCETVATALKLPGTAIELAQDGGWMSRAAYGKGVDADGDGIVVPLEHQGEVVGRLVVAPRSQREPLSAQDHRLLEDIAHQAGALARSVRLTSALQRSRERLVAAREEERRRIRRDLHDGLGPSLASQTFRLDAVLERLGDDPDGAAELLLALKHHNQEMVADIRRLVHELRPPALDELGVAGALAAHAGQLERTARLTIEVYTTPDPLPVLPAAVEVAAYRIAREAITNVVRHAEATRCTASLQAMGSTLSIVVTDDGIGLQRPVRPGVGLTSMRERAEELGGAFEVAPAHPTGTRMRTTLPITRPRSSNPNGHAAAPSAIGAQHG
ncbi:MAG: sensor histidine kinase [Actinomycetota bacterium]|nr:sensor histidine kinase [Actinomycetota bacterium]